MLLLATVVEAFTVLGRTALECFVKDIYIDMLIEGPVSALVHSQQHLEALSKAEINKLGLNEPHEFEHEFYLGELSPEHDDFYLLKVSLGSMKKSYVVQGLI